MKLAIAVLSLAFILLVLPAARAQDSGEEYSLAMQAVHAQDLDIAFMHFRSIAREHPDSKYAKNAIFATGEYYFMTGNYYDAARMFLSFINNYPESNGKLFAEAYLLDIARKQGQEDLVKKLENDIVSRKQLVLLFKNFKEYKYKSPLSRMYKADYYIDKVKFYIDGTMLAEISY
ncbi:MAG: outer membrane protein assembly factor BamD [Candidatus Omnitrophica bacterium]|nr:outer membrane protein assembly factor BamD [Candidatus Omnitrophota bacterium]